MAVQCPAVIAPYDAAEIVGMTVENDPTNEIDTCQCKLTGLRTRWQKRVNNNQLLFNHLAVLHVFGI
jgi:hypothetical protein